MESERRECFSESEARERISRNIDLPGAVRKGLGFNNVRELVALFSQSEVQDMDILCMTGAMNDEEISQYLKILPDYDQLLVRIHEIVLQMMAQFRGELSRVRNADDLRLTMRSGLNNGIKAANNLKITDVRTYRNTLADLFIETYIYEIFEAFQDYVVSKSLRSMNQVFYDIVAESCQIAKAEGKPEFQAGAVLDTKNELRTLLNEPESAKRFCEMTGQIPLDDEQRHVLEQELASERSVILDEAQYKKINFTRIPFGESEMAIMCEDLFGKDNRTGFRQTCAVEISLNPHEKTRLPSSSVWPNGQRFAYFENRPGVFSFVVNRANGELCFLNNQVKPIRCVMSEDQYLFLKKAVYDALFNYLANKEPDIDDLFKKASVIGDARSQLTETVNADGAQNNEDIPPVQTWTYVPWRPSKSENETETFAQNYERERSSKNIYPLVKKLKGLKGNEVLSALRRILGDPLRIQGSHHIFKSPRNGVTYPVPIHGTDAVKFPLLLGSLRQWGISLEEFCAEI